MIPHNYINASDNIAQWAADQIDRQEVTPEFAAEHLVDEPIFVWVGDEEHELGLDPWRLRHDWQYAFKPHHRLFAQRKDLVRLGLPSGEKGGRHDR